MANHRYSASRFGTYSSCLTKYKLTYIDELVVTGRESDLQEKGLAFHEIAEQMDSKKTIKKLNKLAESILEEKNIDQEKYPVAKAIPRFYMWWHEYIKKWESEGYVLFKENWEYNSLSGKALCGAIDMLLVKEDTKDVVIIDFKTGSKANIAGYENQLLLYVYMVGKRLKIKDKDLANKIKTYLFFPLAGIKEEDIDNPESTKKFMNKSFKQLIFTPEDVDNVIKQFTDIVIKSEETNWEELDLEKNATMSFGCSWCPFLGHPTYCPASYKNGFKFPRKAKIMTKTEFKELQT